MAIEPCFPSLIVASFFTSAMVALVTAHVVPCSPALFPTPKSPVQHWWPGETTLQRPWLPLRLPEESGAQPWGVVEVTAWGAAISERQETGGTSWSVVPSSPWETIPTAVVSYGLSGDIVWDQITSCFKAVASLVMHPLILVLPTVSSLSFPPHSSFPEIAPPIKYKHVSLK